MSNPFSHAHGGVHSFSMGVLECYFHLSKKYTYAHPVLHLPKGRAKSFVFNAQINITDDIEIALRNMRFAGPIFSQKELPLKNGKKWVEIAYSLDDVFDPSKYKNAKKRYSRLKYPFKWAADHNITLVELTQEDCKEAVALCDVWGKFKLSDEKVHRYSFTLARYKRCIEEGLKSSVKQGLSLTKTERNDYIVLGIFVDGELQAVRSVFRDAEYAFDLAFFGNTWSGPSQLMNYAEMLTLHFLHQKGIKFFNCGAALNKRLQTFKQHIPSYEVISWMYPKVKK